MLSFVLVAIIGWSAAPGPGSAGCGRCLGGGADSLRRLITSHPRLRALLRDL